MQNQPLVSICIPTYNSAAFLRETIISVLNQKYKNLEIIFTDDCSSDGTVQIIQSFVDDRIHFYKNEANMGIEGNWNRVLGLANGKYVKLLHADDILYPDCIQHQVGVFENDENGEIALVTSHKQIINSNGKVMFTRHFPGETGRISGKSAIRKSIRRGTNIIGEPGIGLIKTEILNAKVTFRSANLYMIDFDFWQQILQHGDLYVLDAILFGFRISKNSISSQLGFSQISAFAKYIRTLSDEHNYGITITDKIMGNFMALLMGIGRNLVYLFTFKMKK